MRALSSSAWSVDDQIRDVVRFMEREPSFQAETLLFRAEFPEFPNLIWSGSWVDTQASKVDVDYMSWVADWIEQHTPIMWEDGEPWLTKEEDE